MPIAVALAVTSTQRNAAPSTCANGIAGVDDGGAVCCKEQCGTCGGVGCSSIPGTTSADCCPSEIIAAGVTCGEAPCMMEGFTPSPVNPALFGTAAPVRECPGRTSTGLGTGLGTGVLLEPYPVFAQIVLPWRGDLGGA